MPAPDTEIPNSSHRRPHARLPNRERMIAMTTTKAKTATKAAPKAASVKQDVTGFSSLEMPAAFFEHFNAALAAYDRLIDFVLDHTGTTPKIRCRKGCANCCIDLVRGINTPAIINIYHHVRQWPDARQHFLYLRDSAEMFMNILYSKLKPGEQGFGGEDPRLKEAHVEYNQKNRPCGFLDQQTGCCKIYSQMPL